MQSAYVFVSKNKCVIAQQPFHGAVVVVVVVGVVVVVIVIVLGARSVITNLPHARRSKEVGGYDVFRIH